ncbi:MAG: 2-hydroxy-3-oxopropionate reductase [Proteobacteria bacterium]|nr:2-hydroxy-3-oxopropionate reductase [Pseudomonadota bacterium]MDE3207911.1 2-hydroxy-3-oxopropionate reductase [Pseudomonadota bacterium]
MSERIGFIGLGIMGRPMVNNLLRAGYPITVYGRHPELLEDMHLKGAIIETSAARLAAQSDIVFTMLPDTDDVESVLFGKEGLHEGLVAGSIVVDMSSISPVSTRLMAKRLKRLDIDMLDAPVSGGDVGAKTGTLSIMVGGDRQIFNQVLPIFQYLGEHIVYMGDHGAGQVTKLCNNLLVAITMAGVGEAFILAGRAGVDLERVREALLGGFAASRVLELHGKRILNGDFEPGFKIELHAKDMKNALEVAREMGLALPATLMCSGYLNAMIGRGEGGQDISAMIHILETLNSHSISGSKKN